MRPKLGHIYGRMKCLLKTAPTAAIRIHRYIRLSELIPEILQMVDDGKIALTPAVELSYLTKDEQRDLLTTMEYDEMTPSLSQAQRLRRLSEDQGLSDNEIMIVMSEVKGNQKEYVRIPTESIRKYSARIPQLNR